MFRKHSLFGFVVLISFQIAFALAVLAFVYSQMQTDPEAERAFPYVAAGLWIFWIPFMAVNCIRYLRAWKAESMVEDAAERDARRWKAEVARDRLLRKSWEEKGLTEEQILEEERKERDRRNREWQERVTREQREQNREINRRIEEEAARKRAERAMAGYCTGCGARLAAGARFCPNCGRKLGV